MIQGPDEGKGYLMEKISGPAIAKVTCSAFWMATVFGANSPTTTFRNVIRENEMTNVRMLVTSCGIFKALNKGPTNLRTVGCPSHPSPRAVTVIPSCVADRYSSRSDVTFFAAMAFLFPSSISWSILSCEPLWSKIPKLQKRLLKQLK